VNQTDSPRVTSDLMTLAEAATHLRTPVAIMRYWRHIGVGPRGVVSNGGSCTGVRASTAGSASNRSARHVDAPRHLLMAHGDA
jgi:hypothetical protein